MTHLATGLESIIANPEPVARAGRIGLLTNPTGIDRRLRSTVHLLTARPDVDLTALYGPEHGVRGDAQAGDHVEDARDPETGLPVFSLYGEHRRPSADALDLIDALVIDLQDIGVRYATYLSTLALVLEACAEQGKHVIVLDRPNPLGGAVVSGNMLDPAFKSFVGTHAMPIRHGLTIGEFARLWNRDVGSASLDVVAMRDWNRDHWYDETGLPWVLPSPNLPAVDTVALYPGTCLLEGTNLSEGRGTTKPFEMIGAPWIDAEVLARHLGQLDLPGVGFRPLRFVPTFSKHAGEPCHGVQIHVLDRADADPVRVGVTLLETVRDLYDDDFQWLPPHKGRHFIDLLAGTDRLRSTIDASGDVDALLAEWDDEAADFAESRRDILLY